MASAEEMRERLATLSSTTPSEIPALLTTLVPRDPDGKLDVAQTSRLAILALKISRRKGRFNEKAAKCLLIYIAHLLRYALCALDGLQALYELFFVTMQQRKSLRPVLCDILFFLTTDVRHVTGWRVKALIRVAKEKKLVHKGVARLVHQYKFLRPEVVTVYKIPANLLRLNSSALESETLGYSNELDQIFENLYRYRTSVDEDFDELNPDAKLSQEEVFEGLAGDLDRIPPSKKRRRALHIHDLLGSADPNPLLSKKHPDQAALSRAIASTSWGIPPSGGSRKADPITLTRCVRVSDLTSNLRPGGVAQPAQTLSLLRNRATFFLLASGRHELRVRLAVTLYHLLYGEFFGNASGTRSSLERQSFILQRVARLQEYFHQGIPVVGRFLTEFLLEWDGETLFVEIMDLLPYIQLTEFEELDSCILLPLTRLFHTPSFPVSRRLLLLSALHRLLLNWTGIEYERSVKRFESTLVNLNYDLEKEAMKEKMEEDSVFGLAYSDESLTWTPLSSLVDLAQKWSDLAEAALVDGDVLSENKTILLNEIVWMMSVTARFYIARDIPLRPPLPPTVVYLSLFDSSAVSLSRVLELIASAKHESIPICLRHIKNIKASDEGRFLRHRSDRNALVRERKSVNLAVITGQVDEASTKKLNTLTNDCLAVLSNQTVYLERNHSIFRRDWHLEDDAIRCLLSVPFHPAFLSISNEFVKKFSSQNKATKDDVWRELQDYRSYAYRSFMTTLSETMPRVAEFLETFQRPVDAKGRGDNKTSCQHSSEHTGSLDGISNVTSGISSMQPTVRRKSNRISAQKDGQKT